MFPSQQTSNKKQWELCEFFCSVFEYFIIINLSALKGFKMQLENITIIRKQLRMIDQKEANK